MKKVCADASLWTRVETSSPLQPQKKTTFLQAALFWSTRARADDDQNERFAVNSTFPLDPNSRPQELPANDESSLYSRHMSYLS